MYNTTVSYGAVQEAKIYIDRVLFNAVFGVVLLFLCEVMGVLGIIANAVNILVFKEQGFKDGINVTLTALAISDIRLLVTQIMYVQILNPWTNDSSYIMSKPNMVLLVIYINDYFIQTSGFITSYAAFERCICVCLPLKVKRFINSKVAILSNVSIFIGLTPYLVLPYSLLYVDWKFLPSSNRTILFVYFKEIRESIINVYFLIAGIIMPYLTIFMLLIFTTVLIVKIKSNVEWRRQAINNAASVNYKERKAVIMLATVSVIYIVSIIPHSSLNTALGIVKELQAGGSLNDLTKLCYFFTCLFETINCSVTTFVYYKMSSKYRQTLRIILPFYQRFKIVEK